jgi:hypothetical protein
MFVGSQQVTWQGQRLYLSFNHCSSKVDNESDRPLMRRNFNLNVHVYCCLLAHLPNLTPVHARIRLPLYMPLVSWHWNAEWQVKVMENSL